MSNEPTPASIGAEVKLWRVYSGEYEPEPGSKHWGVFWEPLNVRLGSHAKPHCCYGNQIAFYDHTGNKLLCGPRASLRPPWTAPSSTVPRRQVA